MTSKTRYILLVDDEQNILSALRRELFEWADERSLEILTAPSGPKGLEALKKWGHLTLVVVSDLKMPEMKGSDFLLEVKKLYPDVVSILLTGFSETNEIVKSVQAGIFSYMVKPWDSDYLIAEITKAFEFGELHRQRAEYLNLVEEELKWAGELQDTILKPNIPRSDGVKFEISYRPVHGLFCGGDYYDVIALDRDRYLLLIGDVAGHGVKAAFVTGILKAIIYPEYVRATMGKVFSPGAFLGWLNERMSFEFRRISSMMLTFFAGVIDLKIRSFLYANAGHNHPYILRNGKSIELPVFGPAIGFVNSTIYSEESVLVGSGDMITLFTDGLIESACTEGSAPICLGSILENVEYGEEYHGRLLKAALAETASSDFADDVTIVTANIL